MISDICKELCASLFHESIPCLKRVKKTQKGIKIESNCSDEEANACISLMYGTLLKLYNLGSKSPTFIAKVRLTGRIQDIMKSGSKESILFVQTYTDLLKLCFMEYVVNISNHNMPCERDIILSYSCMEEYEVRHFVNIKSFYMHSFIEIKMRLY